MRGGLTGGCVPARPDTAGRLRAVIDERLARALHVQTIHHAQLAPEHEPHVLFQASTIGALLARPPSRPTR